MDLLTVERCGHPQPPDGATRYSVGDDLDLVGAEMLRRGTFSEQVGSDLFCVGPDPLRIGGALMRVRTALVQIEANLLRIRTIRRPISPDLFLVCSDTQLIGTDVMRICAAGRCDGTIPRSERDPWVRVAWYILRRSAGKHKQGDEGRWAGPGMRGGFLALRVARSRAIQAADDREAGGSASD